MAQDVADIHKIHAGLVQVHGFIRLEFGNVGAGFRMLDNLKIFVQVLPTIPNDYKIVNRANAGGRYQDEWETANASTTTVARVIEQLSVPLPRTGW